MKVEYFESGATFSRVAKCNGILYFCGHVDGKKGATIQDQARNLLSRYEELFEQYGTDKEHLISVTIYISDIRLVADLNEVYNQWVVPGKAPARVCVEAKIPEGYFFEMSVVAAEKD